MREGGGREGGTVGTGDELDGCDVDLGAEESESSRRGGEGQNPIGQLENSLSIDDLLALCDNSTDTLHDDCEDRDSERELLHRLLHPRLEDLQILLEGHDQLLRLHILLLCSDRSRKSSLVLMRDWNFRE
jgi:hypothetical protein